MTPSKILVACPNHLVKEYSFQRWIDNVTNLTYPSYDVLVVDNSPGGELAAKYGSQVPITALDIGASDAAPATTRVRLNRSMEVIRQHFLAGDYSHWMNIESDVIPQPDVIEFLLEWGRGSDWISHNYPSPGPDSQQGIGCSLLSRRLIEKFGWQGAEDLATPDGWLWGHVRPRASEYPTVELWGYLDVEHLVEPETAKRAAAVRLARLASQLHDESRSVAIESSTDAVTPRGEGVTLSRKHLVSIIVCSRDDAKFAALSERYDRLFGYSQRYEIVRIRDAQSPAEGYNRGVTQSQGDVLIFAHNDVEVLSEDFASRLRSYLSRWDLVGVAGTTRLISPNWVDAGPPYIWGQVAQAQGDGFTVNIYGAPATYVEEVQAMDGVFLAARREVAERVPFDEDRFDGAHMYDVDFTFSAFQAGYRLVVAPDIRVLRAPEEPHEASSKDYAEVFEAKHGRRLHRGPKRSFAFASVQVGSREEIDEVTTPRFWERTGGKSRSERPSDAG